MPGAAVSEIVPGHGCNDNMSEPQLPGGQEQPPGFIFIHRLRPTSGEIAEAAAPGADVAQEHKRGGALGPAASYIGTAGALADGFQVIRVYEARQVAHRFGVSLAKV